MYEYVTHTQCPQGNACTWISEPQGGKMNVETRSSVIHMCAVFTKQPEGKLD